MKQVLRGLNKILPQIKNSAFLNEFLDANMNSFFKVARISSSSISIQILIFLFTFFQRDFYSKLMERYLTLIYDLIKSPTLFEGKFSEQIFDLLYSILKNDYSNERCISFVHRMFSTIMHCESKVVMAGLLMFVRLSQEKLPIKNIVKVQQANTTQIALEVDNDEDSFKDVSENEDKQTKNKQEIAVKGNEEKAEEPIKQSSLEKRNPLYVEMDKSPLF